MSPLSTVILGTGSYAPERILSKVELAKSVDTSDEWIHTRSGIRERRIAAPGEATSDMGVQAARRALDDAGLKPADIDLLITAPDSWVDSHHRFEVLNTLWDQLAQADVSLDLLLSSQIECEARRDWRSHVIGRAYREGRLIDELGLT